MNRQNGALWCCCALGLLTAAGCAGMPRRPLPAVSSSANASSADKLERALALARLQERNNELESATFIYKSVQAQSPKNPTVYHRLAVIAARQNRFDDADANFQRAIQIEGATPDLLTDLGYLRYLQDDLVSAEKMLRSALEQNPSLKKARNNLALVLGEQGRMDESLTEFKRVVGEAEAHANLAYVYSQMGDLQSAQEQYHMALTIDKQLRPAASGLVEIAKRKPIRKQMEMLAEKRELAARANRAAMPPEQPRPTVAAYHEPSGASQRPVPTVDFADFAEDQPAPRRDTTAERSPHSALAKTASDFPAPSAENVEATPVPAQPPAVAARQRREVAESAPIAVSRIPERAQFAAPATVERHEPVARQAVSPKQSEPEPSKSIVLSQRPVDTDDGPQAAPVIRQSVAPRYSNTRPSQSIVFNQRPATTDHQPKAAPTVRRTLAPKQSEPEPSKSIVLSQRPEATDSATEHGRPRPLRSFLLRQRPENKDVATKAAPVARETAAPKQHASELPRSIVFRQRPTPAPDQPQAVQSVVFSRSPAPVQAESAPSNVRPREFDYRVSDAPAQRGLQDLLDE